jgi:nucleotide-binding universal stress UspA family protein
MKNILFPTDFSATSKNARKYAIEIAEKTSAKIFIVNIYSVTIFDPNMPAELLLSAYNEAEKNSKEELDEIYKEISKDIDKKNLDTKIETECISRQGLVVDEIVSLVKEKDVDIIVMGTTGASGLKEIIIGSNTASVIDNSSCLTLAIPNETTFTDIRNIAFATDFSEAEDNNYSKLIDFAKVLNAKIIFLHVCSEKAPEVLHEKEKMFDTIKKKTGYENMEFNMTECDDIFKGINDFIETNEVDVLAMETHHHSLFGKIFHKSLTKKMAYNTKVPLLTLRRDI